MSRRSAPRRATRRGTRFARRFGIRLPGISRPLTAVFAALSLGALPGVGAVGQTMRAADLGQSANTKLWYADQAPTWVRRQGLLFNGVDQRAVIASNASTLAAGKSTASLGLTGNERLRVRMLLNITDPAPATPQILLMVGGDTHGWGVGRSTSGDLFLAIRNGSTFRAIGCAFPAGPTMREVVFDLIGVASVVTIDGILQTANYAEEGGGLGLDQDVTQGAALGNRAPNADNLFHHILQDAVNTGAFETVMGASSDYASPTADMWFSGIVSYVSIQRGFGTVPLNEWTLNDGAGVPTGAPPMESNNAQWGSAPKDSFLFHWTLSALDYPLGSTGGVSPAAAPIVGTGPMGLSSWTDDEGYGEPVMADGPLGIALQTQVSAAPRHSEVFMATPLYNTDHYYIAWTGYIDSSAFPFPGVFTGSVRLNRLSLGDSPAGGPASILVEQSAEGPVMSIFGQDVVDLVIPNQFPFDEPYRVVLRYTPRIEGSNNSGLIILSFDGGATWTYATAHNRPDNYHLRIGWRTNTLFGGRHWIRDIAYGSDLAQVWNATPSGSADLNGDGAVDGVDLAALLSAWGQAGGDADLNWDGVVDGTDLAVMLARWTG